MDAGPVAVLGSGSWGTALAIHVARARPARLWGRDARRMAEMQHAGENAEYLPGVRFPPELALEADLYAALEGVRDVVVVVPSHALRDTFTRVAPVLNEGGRVAWAAKGFEPDSGKLPHEVAAEVFGPTVPLAVLSGPTFAGEVAAGLPGAITVAATDPAFRDELVAIIHHGNFRAYLADDVTGVEVGGAVKNVLAIAAGISDGLGFGANARAALITRGLAEMIRLGVALGGRSETFLGLAGLGDLVLTCTDDQSRNRRLGLALGRGDSRDEAEKRIRQVVEGVGTAREVRRLASKHGVDMPICQQVFRIVHENLAPLDAVKELVGREPRPE